jgi:hypothetical protein
MGELSVGDHSLIMQPHKNASTKVTTYLRDSRRTALSLGTAQACCMFTL